MLTLHRKPGEYLHLGEVCMVQVTDVGQLRIDIGFRRRRFSSRDLPVSLQDPCRDIARLDLDGHEVWLVVGIDWSSHGWPVSVHAPASVSVRRFTPGEPERRRA